MKTFRLSGLIFIAFFFGSLLDIEAQYDKPPQTFNIVYSASVFRNVNLNDAKAATRILVQELITQSRSNYVNTTTIIERIAEKIETMKINDVDMFTFSAMEFLAIKDKIQLYPFSVPVLNDTCLNKIYLLVRKDSNINSVKDLKGKKIILEGGEYDEMSALKIWFNLLLIKNKIDPKHVISQEDQIGIQGSRAVAGVFFKKTDAAVVLENEFATTIELNPQIGRELKILTSSKPLLLAINCYTNKFKDNPEVEVLKSSVYNMHKSKTGMNFIKIFKMKKMIPFKEEYLANISELYNEYSQTIKKNKFQ